MRFAVAIVVVAALAVPVAARPVARRGDRSNFWVPAKKASPEARKARRTAETLLELAGDLDNSPLSRQRASFVAAEAFEKAVQLESDNAERWQSKQCAFDRLTEASTDIGARCPVPGVSVIVAHDFVSASRQVSKHTLDGNRR